MKTIDLSQYRNQGVRVFSGRDRGASVRALARLDELDVTNEQVMVRVPEDTYALNISFFLGLFGASVRACGSREEFCQKYRFEIPSDLQADIEMGIEFALKTQEPLS